MPIRKQYTEVQQTQQNKLLKLKRQSVIVSLIFFVISLNYLIFVRTPFTTFKDKQQQQEQLHEQFQNSSYIFTYLPSNFITFCNVYILLTSLINSLIFRYEQYKKKQLRHTMGIKADYQHFYIEIFKLLNFGIFVCAIIRLFQQGIYQWAYQLAICGYCCYQLFIARVIYDAELRILKIQTNLQNTKKDYEYGSSYLQQQS